MASFLRGKQAGLQKDLSGGIQPGHFCPDEQARYGINSQIRYVLLSVPLPPQFTASLRQSNPC
jgi:hypothetical protein